MGVTSIKDDLISLVSDGVLEKLAISQSVKLQEFECRAQNTIEETAPIPNNIAKSGKAYLSRKQISKMRGNLYLVKSDINLRYDLLDTPDFFWEYPEVERPYELFRYLADMATRKP